jgi:hypothetical protein
MLYIPEIYPEHHCLEIANEFGPDIPDLYENEGPSRRRISSTFVSYKCSLDDVDEPLHALLSRFGHIIPQKIPFGGVSSLGPLGIMSQDQRIDLSFVCFHTLYHAAHIRIKWVDCLSLHLEFDSRSKLLKIFRFPSFCLIMARNDSSSPLTQ